jgi:hypothetical protein
MPDCAWRKVVATKKGIAMRRPLEVRVFRYFCLMVISSLSRFRASLEVSGEYHRDGEVVGLMEIALSRGGKSQDVGR